MPPANVPARAERDEEMKGLLGQLRALPELYANQEAQNGAPVSDIWTQTYVLPMLQSLVQSHKI